MSDFTKLDQLDHVAIPTENIAATVDWYQQHFRCDVVYQDATWALLKFENAQLSLVMPSQHPPHVGFISPTAEAYGELRPHRDGTRSVYVQDPGGNAIEILAPYGDVGGSDD
jgi:catechol 2,3-dioxygenase-like lactoylglutathione lyase family enzyme